MEAVNPGATFRHLDGKPMTTESGKKIYYIKEIFSTIQGEAEFCGVKSLFIRFTDCNMACKFCDTDFSYNFSMTKDELIEYVVSRHAEEGPEGGFHNIVLTGGEPLMQVDYDIIRALYDRGFVVQIETNGTMPMPCENQADQQSMIDQGKLFVTVSPKAKKIHPSILDAAREIKVVLFNKKFVEIILDKYATFIEKNGGKIYIQACAEQDGTFDIRPVYEFIMGRPEYLRMSVQTQKIAGFE